MAWNRNNLERNLNPGLAACQTNLDRQTTAGGSETRHFEKGWPVTMVQLVGAATLLCLLEILRAADHEGAYPTTCSIFMWKTNGLVCSIASRRAATGRCQTAAKTATLMRALQTNIDEGTKFQHQSMPSV